MRSGFRMADVRTEAVAKLLEGAGSARAAHNGEAVFGARYAALKKRSPYKPRQLKLAA